MHKIISIIFAACLLATQPLHADDLQAKRKVFVQKLITKGAIKEITYPGGSLPHVWVTPKLMIEDYQTKSTLLGVVFAYAYDGAPGPSDMLIIRHTITGKRIGRYTTAGLEIH